MAKPIMIQGTMSNAGKSVLTGGLLRVLAQDGVNGKGAGNAGRGGRY